MSKISKTYKFNQTSSVNNGLSSKNFKQLASGYTNINIAKQKVNYTSYKLDGRVSREELHKMLQKETWEDGYDYRISAYYRYGSRCGSKFTSSNLTTNAILFDINTEYAEKMADKQEVDDSVQYFVIYKNKQPEKKGGDDYHNDCLWYALENAFRVLPIEINSRIKLKQFLGLDRCDKVSIDDISKIEELYIKHYQCSINVSGDYKYDSSYINPNKNINLKLIDGHYTNKSNEGRCNTKKLIAKHHFFEVERTEKQVYSVIYLNDDYHIYNGEFQIVSSLELSKLRETNIIISKTHLTDTLDKVELLAFHKNPTVEIIHKVLIATYDDYIDMHRAMYAKSQGKINILKYSSLLHCVMKYLE